MHLQRKAWRNILCAAALVAFALQVTTPLGTPTTVQAAQPAQTAPPNDQQAQPSAVPSNCVSSTQLAEAAPAGTTAAGIGNCYVAADPFVAFNLIGQEHTVTFTCDALVANLYGLNGTAPGTVPGPTTPPGCYNVQATATDITTGSPATIVSATCGNNAAGVTAGAVDCSGVASPICTVGFAPPTAAPAGQVCTPIVPAPGGVALENTVKVTINPGAPHAYRVTFTGYIPTTAQGSCPAGTTYTPGVQLTVSFGTPPVSSALATAPGGACAFSISADKKYAEVTSITLSTTPIGNTCTGTLFYVEGLKAFFGPSCTVYATVLGTVILKSGVDCGTELAGLPSPPTAPTPPYPSGSVYTCTNGTLAVVIPLVNVPVTFTSTAGGSFNTINTVENSKGGVACAGAVGVTSGSGLSGLSNAVLFCPTGPGAGTIQACLSTPLPNNQPPICSNKLPFTFAVKQQRVVPQVRWAGEKIALTKCFGPGLAGQPVEFVLKGNNPGLNATLLPTDLNSTIVATGQYPEADTIWTVTDVNGCASVLGYADGEGQMLVDAAIFNTTGPGAIAGNPLVNEHAFEVFYLKFDHIDLENINPAVSITGATALSPYLSNWAAGTPATLGATTFPNPVNFTLPSAPGANMESAPGSYPVPLCTTQFIRAMVHGYFEIPGDPSGRPATSVSIPGAPLTNGGTPSVGSYVLPAGRWVLPEDWPVLATFAGFGAGSNPADFSTSPVLAWDINNGWVFNPGGENPILCTGNGTFGPIVNGAVTSAAPAAVEYTGAI
ncbi:MAG: hypothetical protein JO112_04175, partial [Planctomycetes bacterium]|nr:hypothetical protein [Planctomycetota bacterium]